MSFDPITAVVPVHTDANGVMRVSNTRVTLDTIIAAYGDGATAEEIVQQYPTVPLADVYSVIGFYLNSREMVEAYLARRRIGAEEVRKQNESRHDSVGIRERLIARQVKQ